MAGPPWAAAGRTLMGTLAAWLISTLWRPGYGRFWIPTAMNSKSPSIYGIPAVRWPGSASHDYFAAVKRSAHKVSLYAIAVESWPTTLDDSTERLKSCRTGKATFSFPALDDELTTELEAFLSRLYQEYRAHHADTPAT